MMREERFKRYKKQRDESFKMLRTLDKFEILSLVIVLPVQD